VVASGPSLDGLWDPFAGTWITIVIRPKSSEVGICTTGHARQFTTAAEKGS